MPIQVNVAKARSHCCTVWMCFIYAGQQYYDNPIYTAHTFFIVLALPYRPVNIEMYPSLHVDAPNLLNTAVAPDDRGRYVSMIFSIALTKIGWRTSSTMFKKNITCCFINQIM